MEPIPYHEHNGTDAPRVMARDLGSFLKLSYHPVTANWPAREGSIVLSDNGSSRRLSWMVGGKVYYVTGTLA